MASERSSVSTRVLRLLLTIGVLALAAAAAWLMGQRAAYHEASTRRQEQAPVAESDVPPPTSLPDIALRFGPDPGLAQWANDMQRNATQLGVSLLTVSNTTVPPQVDRLGRNDIQLQLRGTYPQIKLLLKETLDRHANTSVVRLNMRSMNGVAEVDASVTLVRWSSPAQGDGRATPRPASS